MTELHKLRYIESGMFGYVMYVNIEVVDCIIGKQTISGITKSHNDKYCWAWEELESRLSHHTILTEHNYKEYITEEEWQWYVSGIYLLDYMANKK